MSKDIEVYFKEPLASQLDKSRDLVRFNDHSKRLVYDCFSAQVEAYNTVSCKKGHQFRIGNNKIGKMTLTGVLRGNMNPKVCQDCPDYNDGGEEE